MKPSTSIVIATAALFIVARQCEARDAHLNDKPLDPEMVTSIRKRINNGDYSGFNELVNTNSTKAVIEIADFVSPSDADNEARAVAAGEALVKLKAETYLCDSIRSLSKVENVAADRERGIIFVTLAFMKSKATVRGLASFLNDASPRERQDNIIGDNSSNALIALCKLKIKGAPSTNWHMLGVSEKDLTQWREWWKSNADKFQGEGALPSE